MNSWNTDLSNINSGSFSSKMLMMNACMKEEGRLSMCEQHTWYASKRSYVFFFFCLCKQVNKSSLKNPWHKILPVASQFPTACVADFPGMSWDNCTTENIICHTIQPSETGLLHVLDVTSINTIKIGWFYNSYPKSASDIGGTHGRRQFLNCSGSSIWDSSPVVNSCTI